jgi:ATP synthase protein I
LGWAEIFDFLLAGGADTMSDRDGLPPASSAGGSDGDEGLSERLRDLERRLDVRRVAREEVTRAEAAPPVNAGYGMAMRLGADFVAGVAVGAALGWGFDRLFGTSPWGLMVFLLLGFAAGVLSLLRTAGLMKAGPLGRDNKA